MAEGDASRLENSIHWWAFGLVTATGILMLGAALGLSIISDWTGIWIDFFLTVGATVLLGALGIVGSGVLVTTVQREVKEVQRGIDETEAETAALEERLESQAGRLSTLADEVYENRQDQHDAQDAALAAMASDLTYEAVTAPLRQADLRRAISDAFRVPAFRDLNGMHMGFKYLIRMDRMVGGTPLLSLARGSSIPAMCRVRDGSRAKTSPR